MTLITMMLAGAGLGAAIGFLGKCSSGACLLASTWRRGALFGATVGALVFFTSARNGLSAPAESSQNVVLVNEAQFAAQVEKAKLPVVVDFYADWCGPCKVLSPMLSEVAGQYTNRVMFVKVNVDDSAALAQKYQIQALPTLVFFKEGKESERTIGLLPKSELEARIKALVGTNAVAPGGR